MLKSWHLINVVPVPRKYLQIEDIYLHCFSGQELFFSKKKKWNVNIFCILKLENVAALDLCVQTIILLINQLLQGWHKKCYETFFE